MANITTIGAHRFFRWKGPAGLAAAFTAAYVGHEPLPAPHPKTKASEAPAPDPIELERAYEASLAAMQPATVIAQRTRAGGGMTAGYAGPAPSYSAAIEARGGDAQFTASRLPGAGEVRQEYSASGQWITHP